MKSDGTAYETWQAVLHFFTANKAGRSMHLRREFHALRQGYMSVDGYCSKLKALADALADVDDPIEDRQLVLQLLEGLDEKFNTQSELISRAPCRCPSSPPFRTGLQLAEVSIKNKAAQAASQAMVVHTSGNGGHNVSGASGDRNDRGDRGRQHNGHRGGLNGGDRGGHRGGYNSGGGRGGYQGNQYGGYNGGYQQTCTSTISAPASMECPACSCRSIGAGRERATASAAQERTIEWKEETSPGIASASSTSLAP
jgi:hypothetical protein